MLKLQLKVTMRGESFAEEQSIAGFQAEIDSENPENMTISTWQNDKAGYKNNRETARADQAAFEDAAYQKQDEMIAEKEAK